MSAIKPLYKMDDSPSLAMLDQYLLCSCRYTSVDENVGVRWILDNLERFAELVQWQVAGFMEDHLDNRCLTRLVQVPDFLKLMPVASDRDRVLRMFYLEHGSYNCDWSYWLRKAGVPRETIGEIVVARLAHCLANAMRSELWRELGYFVEVTASGRPRKVRPGPDVPEAFVLDDEHSMWSALTDKHFADALRIVMRYFPGKVLDYWFVVSVKLNGNKTLLDTLFKEVVASITYVDDATYNQLMRLPSDCRRQVVGQLTPLPGNDKPLLNENWWKQPVAGFRLLLHVMNDCTTISEAMTLYNTYIGIFDNIDPVRLYRECAKFFAGRAGIGPQMLKKERPCRTPARADSQAHDIFRAFGMTRSLAKFLTYSKCRYH